VPGSAGGTVALVHNGIIDNAAEWRDRLEEGGASFESDTDSEVIAHLVAQLLAEGLGLEHAVRAMMDRLVGTLGLAVMATSEPRRLVVARRGSPILVGRAADGWLVASDEAAMAGEVRDFIRLGDHDLAVIDESGCRVQAPGIGWVQRKAESLSLKVESLSPGIHPDFMSKEIREQPDALRRTLAGRVTLSDSFVHLAGVSELMALHGRPGRITLVGCGSAHHACEAGRYLLEQWAGIPSQVAIASEFRPRPDHDASLVVAVSQSGETADTLDAVRRAAALGRPIFGLVNVAGSSLAAEVDFGMHLHAGPEVGVASTKAWTAQVAGLAMLAAALARTSHQPSDAGTNQPHESGPTPRMLEQLRRLPDLVEQAQETEPAIRALAEALCGEESWYFLGRGTGLPVAREGALKLKEISYVHAEGLPAGEVKHGPLALVRPGFPAVVLVPGDADVARNIATIRELQARGARVIAIGDGEGLEAIADDVVRIPPIDPLLFPILAAIPLQWLAYHVAKQRGCDVDRPRNLAKSVTVH
jgi:glucosamine--fructose-6-phosphate aminotransferase (isomerizing)